MSSRRSRTMSAGDIDFNEELRPIDEILAQWKDDIDQKSQEIALIDEYMFKMKNFVAVEYNGNTFSKIRSQDASFRKDRLHSGGDASHPALKTAQRCVTEAKRRQQEAARAKLFAKMDERDKKIMKKDRLLEVRKKLTECWDHIEKEKERMRLKKEETKQIVAELEATKARVTAFASMMSLV
ncbi:hypothetical protein L596_027315 [Steinernema carpocapsae]|uniref:Uncharacterized protein n=1 Tax=Steinernema carpocapsae TaxID=34508 RepID=A0A4U5M3Y6_STECR|nr:hypothetical protein L596_027315 [Steinernema carpocapsae]